jgi:hypothetical protein
MLIFTHVTSIISSVKSLSMHTPALNYWNVIKFCKQELMTYMTLGKMYCGVCVLDKEGLEMEDTQLTGAELECTDTPTLCYSVIVHSEVFFK